MLKVTLFKSMQEKGWGYSSEIECLPRMHEDLGPGLSPAKPKIYKKVLNMINLQCSSIQANLTLGGKNGHGSKGTVGVWEGYGGFWV
jgi:hypothetical protein